uniref:Xylulose kinase-1 n=1 Tax=Tanacetum cinerariifolium TaxID=118510 RepID=A0A699I089_TANCI|nr:hypothetical protein [Tanacetum cinerariifolium]
MSTPTFAETHNLVAFLEKPAESAGFEQIIDLLKSKPIYYALTVNLTIYVSGVKQFWATTKVKKVNDQEQIQALVDKKKIIITEDSIRSDLRFNDAEGTACLLNEAIFEGLACMSAKTTAWNEFSSTMASAIICLADMGDTPVETHQTPTVDQPSTSKPQKKQKPRRKQRKEVEVSNDESEDEDHVPTPSSDPLPSGEDSFTLNELMGRINDDEMFGVDDLTGEEVVMDTTTGEHEEQIIKDVSTAEPVTIAGEVVTTTTVKDIAAPIIDINEDEITMAQALAALKSIKPKVVQLQIPTVSSSKDKGLAKMIEPKVPIKKKDQIRIDEEYARKLEAKEQEAARLSRAQQDEEANNSWDNIQAMMDADRLLAKRLQAREREEFSEVQKARLSFDEIKKLFDREMRKVNDFIAMDLEAQESSTKRTAEHLKSDISKKQKEDENVKPVIDDTEELKKCVEIVPGDGDEAIFKDRFKKEKPVDDMDDLLFRTLKTMFEHHVEGNIWKYQQGLAKVYPLTRNTLHQLWSDVRLQVDYDVEMAYDLLRFIRKQLMEGYTPQ